MGVQKAEAECAWVDCHGRILAGLRVRGFDDLGVGLAGHYLEWASHVSAALTDVTRPDWEMELADCFDSALDQLLARAAEFPDHQLLVDQLLLPNLFAFQRHVLGGRDAPAANVYQSPLWVWWTTTQAHVRQLLDDAPIPTGAFERARSEIEKWVKRATDALETNRDVAWYLDPDSLDTVTRRACDVLRSFPDALYHLHAILGMLASLTTASQDGDVVREGPALLAFTPSTIPATFQPELAKLREAAANPLHYPPPWDPTRNGNEESPRAAPAIDLTSHQTKELRRWVRGTLWEWDGLVEWFIALVRQHLPDERGTSPAGGSTFEICLLAWTSDARRAIEGHRWNDVRYCFGDAGISYLKECVRAARGRDQGMTDAWFQMYDQISRYDANRLRPLLSRIEACERNSSLDHPPLITDDPMNPGDGAGDTLKSPLFPRVMRRNGHREISRKKSPSGT